MIDKLIHLPQLALSKLLSCVIPHTCSGCSHRIQDKYSFCHDCWSSIQFINHNTCTQCGYPLLQVQCSNTCPQCSRSDISLHVNTKSVCLYQGLIRSMIKRLKYNDETHITNTMSKLMLTIEQDKFWNKVDIITNIPMDSKSTTIRMYNQSALLAKALYKLLQKQYPNKHRLFKPNMLIKSRLTYKQASLNRKSRLQNVHNSMNVNPLNTPNIPNPIILIVDDIITTGATIEEARRTIKNKIPNAEISAITFARTTIDDKDNQ